MNNRLKGRKTYGFIPMVLCTSITHQRIGGIIIKMDLLFDLLKDKTKVIAFLLETIQETAKQKEGLAKLSESLTRENPNHSIENIAKCLAVTMKTESKQAQMIQSLATICLVYAQSSSFDSNIGHMMVKMGRGEEALQQMFKNKMEGKG